MRDSCIYSTILKLSINNVVNSMIINTVSKHGQQ